MDEKTAAKTSALYAAHAKAQSQYRRFVKLDGLKDIEKRPLALAVFQKLADNLETASKALKAAR